MPSYTSPGVYIQDVVSGSQTIDQAASSIGAMIGVALSGPINIAEKIGSWTEYIEKFAKGLASPFDANNYLPYAVYGFFQNGGKELYIVNVRDSATKATATGSDCKLVVTAAYEGAWGNSIKVTYTKNAEWTASNLVYDVTVTIGSSFSVTIAECYITDIIDKLNSSEELSGIVTFAIGAATALDEEEVTLSGGSNGNALTDSKYLDALNALDILDDVTLVAIPGQTSSTVNDGIIAYCENHELFPIIDVPVAYTVAQTKTYRKGISTFTGALAYPWGKMNDPLTDALKSVPTAGHLMGVYARVIEERGVFKAPAGTDAQVRGFIEMVTVLTPANISTLNPVGVICICSRPNAGIVVWGARSLNSSDTTMRYVSDGLLNLNIKRSLYAGTQFAVFEPNDENLWSRVNTSCKAFLEMLRQQGALKGEPDEAYYVTVDSSNNTPATIAAGQLNIEIGYAPVKPAEFVIIKLAHSIVAAE